jgi:PadR family transcriptional regulator, regulatory protein AphA
MTTRLSETSHAILGLLSIAPMSGYDLFGAVDRSVSRFWPISKSQVYAELAKLEPAGLIEGVDVAQDRRPDKKIFRLTEAGETALDDWLDHADLGPPQLRAPFLLKMFFGHRRSQKDAARLLDDVRAAAELDAGDYSEFVELLRSDPGAVYAQVVALFEVRMAEAVAAWAAEALALLPPDAVQIDPRRSDPKKAIALFRAVPLRRRGGTR